MAAKTRLGQIGVGVERYAGFVAKEVSRPPVTRLGQIGVGVERYRGFVAKTAAGGGATARQNNPMIASVGALMRR